MDKAKVKKISIKIGGNLVMIPVRIFLSSVAGPVGACLPEAIKTLPDLASPFLEDSADDAVDAFEDKLLNLDSKEHQILVDYSQKVESLVRCILADMGTKNEEFDEYGQTRYPLDERTLEFTQFLFQVPMPPHKKVNSDELCNYLIELYNGNSKYSDSKFLSDFFAYFSDRWVEIYLTGEISSTDLGEILNIAYIRISNISKELNTVKKDLSGVKKRVDGNEAAIAALQSALEKQQLQNPSLSDWAEKSTDNYKTAFTNCMFLNGTEKNPQEVSLKDVYQVPRFCVENDNPRADFCQFFNKFLCSCYKKYTNQKVDRVLTVLGDPGSGKSSLIQYILNDDGVQDILKNNSFTKVRVLRFSELKDVVWDNSERGTTTEDLIPSLLKACGYSVNGFGELDPSDQLKDTILFLDGFDEIELLTERSIIIEKIKTYINGKTAGIERCAVVITCRDNYIKTKDENRNSTLKNYIRLLPLNQTQVQNFCDRYNFIMKDKGGREYDGKVFGDETLFQHKQGKSNEGEPLGNVLGTPLILYMVIALNVSLKSSQGLQTITDVYDELFKTQGGIYDPSDKDYIENSTVALSREQQIPVNEQLLKTSKLIAVEMFRTAPSKAIIEPGVLKVLANNAIKEIDGETAKNQFEKRLLGDVFLRQHGEKQEDSDETTIGSSKLEYLEGSLHGESICFIHRSIYEYFVGKYICDQISIFNNNPKPEAEEVKDAINCLKSVLQSRLLSDDIRKHLVRELKKEFATKNFSANLSKRWSRLFESFLQNGFLYVPQYGGPEEVADYDYSELSVRQNAVVNIRQEIVAFLNWADIIRCLYDINGELSRGTEKTYVQLCSGENKKLLNLYVRMAVDEYQNNRFIATGKSSEENEPGLYTAENQKEPVLVSKVDLRYLELSEINLENKDLSGVLFDMCCLSESVLSHCTFKNTSLSGTDMSGTYMPNSLMKGISVNPAQIGKKVTDFTGARLQGSNMQNTVLSNAIFTNAHLENCCLYSSDLTNAHFDDAYLDGADLTEVKAENACFAGASMIRANMEDADCDGADFTGAKLFDTKWMGTALNGSIFDEEGKIAVEYGDGKL